MKYAEKIKDIHTVKTGKELMRLLRANPYVLRQK